MNGKDLGPVSHWISSMNFGPLDAIIGNDVWLFHTLSCIHFFFDRNDSVYTLFEF